MIRIIATLTALLTFAGPAAAQTVAVRSGEHGAFTRLVLSLPRTADWAIERDDRRLALSLSIPDVRLTTDQVFSRIPRDRVQEVSQAAQGGPLTIRLGCDCEVRGFLEGGTLLVIDIADPQGPAKDVARTTRKIATPRYGFDLGEPVASPPPAKEEVQPEFQPAPTLLLPSPVELAQSGSNQIEGLDILERRLIEQLGRASGQGLVTPVAPARLADPEPIRAPLEQDTPQLDRLPPGITVTTTVDRDMAQVVGALLHQSKAASCLDPEIVAVERWGDDRPFAMQISTLRAELVEEFDRIDPATALKLARTYLRFGFGAEAAHIIDLAALSGPEARGALALARLIDRGELNGDNPFSNQQKCDNDVALWAAFAEPIKTDEINNEAVLRAFGRLPPHLREHLGPTLSRRFGDAGDRPTAEALLRMLRRSGGDSSPDLELAEARTAELRGESDKAMEKLSKVAETDTEQAPKALIALVKNQYELRGSIAPDVPVLAAGFALEHRRSELGVKLRETVALSLALADRFDEAFDALDPIEELNGPESRLQTESRLLYLIEERADDLTFLRLALHTITGQESAYAEDLGNRLARRILDLGFAETAIRLLAGSTEGVATEDRRLLRAEAALAQQLPHEAMVALLGMEGPEAARLRAEAMLQRQDYLEAGQMLQVAEDRDGAARSLWLADSFQQGVEPDPTQYELLAGATGELARPDPELDGLTPLARARALIDKSTSTRNDIEDLLQKVTVSVDND